MNVPEEVDMPEEVDAEVTWTFEEEVSTEEVESAPVEELEQEDLELDMLFIWLLMVNLGEGRNSERMFQNLGLTTES